MARRLLTSLCAAPVVAALILVAPASINGQTPPTAKKPATVPGAARNKGWVAQRLPWGDPDVQGNFTTKEEMNTPMERPDQFAGRRIEDVSPQELALANRERQRRALANAPYPGGGSRALGIAIAVPVHWFDNLDSVNSRPWLVIDPPDGKIPPQTDEARQRAASRSKAQLERGTADSFTDRSIGDRCISFGAPSMVSGGYGGSYQIVQTKDFIAIRYEMVHEARLIPIEGRGGARLHNGPRLRTYAGDAVARWEGDTLVVDTTNYNDQTTYRGVPAERLHLIERFRRTAAKKVELAVTVDEPHTWTRPWTYSIPLTEDDGQPIFEYACHEGNYGLRNILSAGRSDDRKGIKSSNDADSQADLRRGEFDE